MNPKYESTLDNSVYQALLQLQYLHGILSENHCSLCLALSFRKEWGRKKRCESALCLVDGLCVLSHSQIQEGEIGEGLREDGKGGEGGFTPSLLLSPSDDRQTFPLKQATRQPGHPSTPHFP